jgi:tRNA 2-selenouridine synthase SelU
MLQRERRGGCRVWECHVRFYEVKWEYCHVIGGYRRFRASLAKARVVVVEQPYGLDIT